MRIVVIADIHGNLAALEAVLRRVKDLSPDQLVVAGDIVNGGPDSRLCWERIQEIGCPVIRGNHERYVYDYGSERAAPEWSTDRFGPLRYTVEEMGSGYSAALAALPAKLTVAGAPEILIVHASGRNDVDNVSPFTREEDLEVMFPSLEQEIVVRGHNHYCSSMSWQSRRIFTTGAVGSSLDGTRLAQFLLLDLTSSGWAAKHQAVPYDVEATLRRFQESNYLERSGPMGRLFIREIATGVPHFVPFLRYYFEWNRHHKISLVEGLHRYFSDF